ncbi:hypothetical protein GCM10009125_03680 [Castellaniella daejeonensis]|uniref:Transposase n=1 Tax=Castellaniella daejeonensis TaxID=659013 RepID=A0ABP3CXW8_9BURK
MATELAALIAVDDDLGLWATAPDSRQQGVEHQIGIDATTHGPAHHGTSNHERPNMALGGITPKQRLAMAA